MAEKPKKPKKRKIPKDLVGTGFQTGNKTAQVPPSAYFPVLARYPELRRLALEHIAKYGSLEGAAQAIRLSAATLKQYMSKDEDFRLQVEEALGQHRARIERAIFKRAVEGWDEPRFSSRGVVGTVRRYSDTLLMFYAKRHMKEYRDTEAAPAPFLQQVNNVVLDFDQLNPDQRKALRLLLTDSPEEENLQPTAVKARNGSKNGSKNGKRNGTS